MPKKRLDVALKTTHFLKTCFKTCPVLTNKSIKNLLTTSKQLRVQHVFKTYLALTKKSIKNLLSTSKQLKVQLNIFWQTSLSILSTVLSCNSSSCSFTICFIKKFCEVTLCRTGRSIVCWSGKKIKKSIKNRWLEWEFLDWKLIILIAFFCRITICWNSAIIPSPDKTALKNIKIDGS